MQSSLQLRQWRDWLVAWRPLEIVEAIVGVAIVTVLDLILPQQWGIQHLDLYTLWVIVLAIAARYGAPAGYIAGGLSAMAFLLVLVIKTDANQPLAPHVEIQPFLLFTSGVMVSEVVRARNRFIVTLEDKLRRANATVREVGQQLESALSLQNELERRIAVQPVSIAAVCEFARKMMTHDQQAIYTTALDMMRSLLQAERCSLYLLDHDNEFGPFFRLVAGQPEAWPGRPPRFAKSGNIIDRAVRERRVITVRDELLRDGVERLSSEPVIMAGPLLDRHESVIGLLLIERLPFTQFTPSNIHLFEQLLDLTAGALIQARDVRLIEQVS